MRVNVPDGHSPTQLNLTGTAFSSVRVYALCNRRITLPVLVGFLSIVPAGANAVSNIQVRVIQCR